MAAWQELSSYSAAAGEGSEYVCSQKRTENDMGISPDLGPVE